MTTGYGNEGTRSCEMMKTICTVVHETEWDEAKVITHGKLKTDGAR